MYYLVVLALIYPAISLSLDNRDREHQVAQISTTAPQTRVDALKWFSTLAQQHVTQINIGGTNQSYELSWEGIKSTNALPPSVTINSIPSNWLIKGDSTQRIICVGTEDKGTVMRLMAQERALSSKGINSAIQFVTFGVFNESSSYRMTGASANGVNNVC